jgi:hypothetical protein
MDENLNQKLLASFGDMGEALVAQSILEAGGVPCRVGDLAGLPKDLYGMIGSLGRIAGIWVLAVDVERATALLAEMRESGPIDDAALAAEAMAAGRESDAAARAEHAEQAADAGGKGFSPTARVLAFLGLLAALALVIAALHR